MNNASNLAFTKQIELSSQPPIMLIQNYLNTFNHAKFGKHRRKNVCLVGVESRKIFGRSGCEKWMLKLTFLRSQSIYLKTLCGKFQLRRMNLFELRQAIESAVPVWAYLVLIAVLFVAALLAGRKAKR